MVTLDLTKIKLIFYRIWGTPQKSDQNYLSNRFQTAHINGTIQPHFLSKMESPMDPF